MQSTIYALATPVGGAIAVIRISGPDAYKTLEDVFSAKEFTPRQLVHGFVHDGERKIDEAMAVYLREPLTYTGEDCAELYLHGGPAVVASTLELLAKRGLNLAAPGEFTKRAFLNGKLDLSQAEAVMDLISASAEQSASAALEQLAGSVYKEISGIETQLIDLLASLEAAIDYPEELEEDTVASASDILEQLQQRLAVLIRSGLRGRLLREGLKVVIAGRPNVGKSSLLNALLGENRAIVTDIPGTTRDLIREAANWNGLPVRLTDTAGLREAEDRVEEIGVSLAREAIAEADLLMLVFDGAEELTQEDRTLLEDTKDRQRIAVLSKSDLPQKLTPEELEKIISPVIPISTVLEQGIEQLKETVLKRTVPPPERDSVMITNRRHLDALEKALDAIKGATASLEAGMDIDCVAIDIRTGLLSLGEITGTLAEEAVINRIFEKFCLGK